MTPSATAIENPFFTAWTQPFGLAPFSQIEIGHYQPAFERAMEEHDAEIAAIAANPAPPDFENTIAAQERAGAALNRVGGVFWNLVSTNATPELQAVERVIAPKLAVHYSAIGLNPALFKRVEALHAERESLGLNVESLRVLDLTYDSFLRSGARLGAQDKLRYSEIAERLATLGAQFSQNVLADESSWLMLLDKEDDLDGLPVAMRDAAGRTAEERGFPGQWAITLSRSSVEPFLFFASRRDLRERAQKAWASRGENGGATDNRAIIAEIVRLRDETARLIGYPSYAHFKLADKMAAEPDHVRNLLDTVWVPAKARAAREQAVLQDMIADEGGNFQLAIHDWRYYSEKARRALHDLDESDIRPYLQLDNLIAAAFDVANKLFGLHFTPATGLDLPHPEMQAFDVRDANGKHIALFLGDYFARPSKRSGAWMSSFRSQQKLDGDIRPIIINVLNFVKAGDGEPALLGLDDARTLFHEFGHGLHGMLSDVTYPSIAGTGVATDFVEFPSQLYEHWFLQPQVLEKFALHFETNQPMPKALVDKVMAARTFNQGFATVEYSACAIVDLELHSRVHDASLDVTAFERETLAKIGMPDAIAMRHRTPHFSHLFSGSGYAAGYYSYLWSEVLDADGFKAFEDSGDIFNPALAERLKKYVYSAGGREKPDDAYRHFRGRDPQASALLEKRGLA